MDVWLQAFFQNRYKFVTFKGFFSGFSGIHIKINVP